jgi:hypothetical protein
MEGKEVERLRAWYRGGGRIELPLEFYIEESGAEVRVCARAQKKSNEFELAVEELFFDWFVREGAGVEVRFGDFRAEVYSDKIYAAAWGRREVRVVFRYELGMMFFSLTGWGSQWIKVKSKSEAELVKIFFEFLKRELEERLNGILEKVLFE